MTKPVKIIRYSNLPIVIILFVFMLAIFAVSSEAQTGDRLENRVRAIENYVETFEPTLRDFSNNFEKSIRQYTIQLETSLQSFSSGLELRINERLNQIEHRRAIFDPYAAGAYQQIETKSGEFLIAIKKVTPITNGIRLSLDVGNPNNADYKDFTIKLIWGKVPPNESGPEYDRWRNTLMASQFTFKGKLEKGYWNEIEVDLVPLDRADFSYLELEMEVASVELQYKKY